MVDNDEAETDEERLRPSLWPAGVERRQHSTPMMRRVWKRTTPPNSPNSKHPLRKAEGHQTPDQEAERRFHERRVGQPLSRLANVDDFYHVISTFFVLTCEETQTFYYVNKMTGGEPPNEFCCPVTCEVI
jgi:hypothetical protein